MAEGRSKVFRLPEPTSQPKLEAELDYRWTLLPAGGRHMIATKYNGGLVIYDLQDRKEVAHFPREDGAPIVAMACTKDGAVLATVDEQDLLQVWLVELTHCVFEVSAGEPIRRMAFSGNGRYLSCLTQKGTLIVWEMEWQLDPDVVTTPAHIEERLPTSQVGVWGRLRARFGRHK